MTVSGAVSLFSQTTQPAPATQEKELAPSAGVDEGHAKRVPAPSFIPTNSPFAIEGRKPERSVRVLSEEEMSREDRDLLANAESSIQERAGIENLEFNGAGWTYHQLVCPALPNHIFIRFTRDDGTRQMSMFSAAIPRNGNGRIHIIPIVRRGYSLFSPAPIGAMTIAAFNRIRTEEGEGATADWLGTGLCYAALAGANPKVEQPAVEAGKDIYSTMAPTLLITAQGGATIRFADVSNAAKPVEWSMVFDPKGKLVKASHEAAYVPSGGKAIGGKDVKD